MPFICHSFLCLSIGIRINMLTSDFHLLALTFLAGLAVMSKLAQDRHQQLECDFEDISLDWDRTEMLQQ